MHLAINRQSTEHEKTDKGPIERDAKYQIIKLILITLKRFIKMKNVNKVNVSWEEVESMVPVSEQREQEVKQESSYIPDSVYQNLPPFLQEACKLFKDKRERDVFLTSSLITFSGIFDTLTATYDNRNVHANLYGFIVAPPASGKASMLWARRLGESFHDRLKTAQVDTPTVSADNGTNKMIAKGPKGCLFIPANSSSAAVMQHIARNNRGSIFCETEADTMANTFAQEWGDYSDMFRKAFHHEPISYSRKTENEHIEINNPQLSVLLTGTPNQVRGIIKSAEDGLFSRFIFYTYQTRSGWHDVSPGGNKVNFEDAFNSLSDRIADFATSLTNRSIIFEKTKFQWDTFDKFFSSLLYKTIQEEGETVDSVVKRLGLISFRISMILGLLREIDQEFQGDKLICRSDDSKTAIELTKVYFDHSLLVYDSLPHRSLPENITKYEETFFNALPEGQVFSSGEAIIIGERLNLKRRTIGNYLKKGCAVGILDNPRYSFYAKL